MLKASRWFQDLDHLKVDSLRVKGRCSRCWGGLVGEGDGERSEPTVIRCRVCGFRLEGGKAGSEYSRMLTAAAFAAQYGFSNTNRTDADFVMKLFRPLARLSETELRQRYRGKVLTRNDFPAGSAGFLSLQARLLMSEVDQLPLEASPVPDSGAFSLNDPSGRERETMRRMGRTMSHSMMSAFACELAMKSIHLTCQDQAPKTHDLWCLYKVLPDTSRTRLEEDWAEVGIILRKARHTFGEWRYFEVNVGGRGMMPMIDTDQASGLAKAARVLLDESEVVGLGFSLTVKSTPRRGVHGENRQSKRLVNKVDITGIEALRR